MQLSKLFLASPTSFLILTAAAHAGGFNKLPLPCGSDAEQYKVKTVKAGALPTVESGKAQLVFLQSLDGDFSGDPITRLGVDGTWAGAVKGDSYFVVSLTPGTHHICASRQTSITAEKENVGTATVEARAGETYYYAFKITRSEIGALARSNGGTGLSGSAPTGQTPDMTAKRRDTVDTVVFTDVDTERALLQVKKDKMSVSTHK